MLAKRPTSKSAANGQNESLVAQTRKGGTGCYDSMGSIGGWQMNRFGSLVVDSEETGETFWKVTELSSV